MSKLDADTLAAVLRAETHAPDTCSDTELLKAFKGSLVLQGITLRFALIDLRKAILDSMAAVAGKIKGIFTGTQA